MHLQETDLQIDRINECFSLLGVSARPKLACGSLLS
jgi:ferritin-like metal-binding protein YciE